MSRTLSPSRSFIANTNREPRAASRGGLSMSNVTNVARSEAGGTRTGPARSARLTNHSGVVAVRPGSGSPTSPGRAAHKDAGAAELHETNADAQCVRALFAALCTAIPEDVRLELLYDSMEELKFLIAIQPRLSAFGVRARHSLRHPALALATRKVYWVRHVKAMEEAEEDEERGGEEHVITETEAWHPNESENNNNNRGRMTAAPSSPTPSSRLAGHRGSRVPSPQPPVPQLYAAVQRLSTEPSSQSQGEGEEGAQASKPGTYDEEEDDEVGVLGHSASTLMPQPSTLHTNTNGGGAAAAAASAAHRNSQTHDALLSASLGSPRSAHRTQTQPFGKNKEGEGEKGGAAARTGQSSRPTPASSSNNNKNGNSHEGNTNNAIAAANVPRRPSNTRPLSGRSRQYSIATSANASVYTATSRKSRKTPVGQRGNTTSTNNNGNASASENGVGASSPRTQGTGNSPTTFSAAAAAAAFTEASQTMRSATTMVRAAHAHSRNARNALDEEEKAIFHPILAKPRFQLLQGMTYALSSAYTSALAAAQHSTTATTNSGAATTTTSVTVGNAALAKKAGLEDADEQALMRLQENEERRWARLAACYEQMLRVIFQARRTAALAVAQDAAVNDIIRRFWERVTLSGRAVSAAEQQAQQAQQPLHTSARAARRSSLGNDAGPNNNNSNSNKDGSAQDTGTRRERKRRGNAALGARGAREADTNYTDTTGNKANNNNNSSKTRKARGRNEAGNAGRKRRGGRNAGEFTPEASMTTLDARHDEDYTNNINNSSAGNEGDGRRTSRNVNRQTSLSTSNTMSFSGGGATGATGGNDRRKPRAGGNGGATKGKRNSGNTSGNVYDGAGTNNNNNNTRNATASASARRAANNSASSAAHHPHHNHSLPENEVVYMSPMQYIYLHTRIAHVLLPRSVELEVEMLEAVQEDLLIDAAYRDDVAPQQLFFGRAPLLFTRSGMPLPNTPHPLNPLTVYTRRNMNSGNTMGALHRPGSGNSSNGGSYALAHHPTAQTKGNGGGSCPFPLTAYTLRAQQWSQERDATSTAAASPHAISATVSGHNTTSHHQSNRANHVNGSFYSDPSDDRGERLSQSRLSGFAHNGPHRTTGGSSGGGSSHEGNCEGAGEGEEEEEAALWNARRLPCLSFAQFWNAMLELADNWTCSAGKPAEYAAFLMELYAEVFGHDWDDEELEREVNAAAWYHTGTFLTSSPGGPLGGSRPASASSLSLYATGRADAVQQASMEVLRSFHNMVKSLEEMSSSDSGKEAEMHRSWFGEYETPEETTHRPTVDKRRSRTSDLFAIEAFNEDFERDTTRVHLQESEWIYDDHLTSATKTHEEGEGEERGQSGAERIRRKRILLPSRRARMAASAARRRAGHEAAMYRGTNEALAAEMQSEDQRRAQGKRHRRAHGKGENDEDERLSSFASSATLLSGHGATSLAHFPGSAEGAIVLADDDDRTIDSELYSVYVIEEELDEHNHVIRRRRYHQKREEKEEEEEEKEKRRFSLSLDEVVDENAESSDEFQYVRHGSRGLLRQRVRFDARPQRTRRLDLGDRKDDYEDHAHDNLSAETSWSSFSLSRSLDQASAGLPRRRSDEEEEEEEDKEGGAKDATKKTKDVMTELTLENRGSRRHHRRVRVRRVGKRRDMRREYRSPEYYYRGRRAEQARTAREVAAHLAAAEEEEEKKRQQEQMEKEEAEEAKEEEEEEEEVKPPTPLTEEELSELMTKKMWLQKTLAAKGLPLADSLFADASKQSMLYKLLCAAEAQAARRARGETVEEDVGIAGFDAELLARIFENTEFSIDELQRSELIRLLLETADEDGRPRMELSAGQMNDVLAALLQRRNADRAPLEPGSVRRHRERLIACLEQQLVVFTAEGKARRFIEREREATLVMLNEKAAALRTRAIAEAAMQRETFGMTELGSAAKGSAARRRRASFAALLGSADGRGRRNNGHGGEGEDEKDFMDDETAMTTMSLARPTWAAGNSGGREAAGAPVSAGEASRKAPEMTSEELAAQKLLPDRLTRAQRREQERLFREFEAFCAAQISQHGRYRVELTEYTPAQLQAFFVQLGLTETQRALLRGRAPLAAATSLVGGGIFHQLPNNNTVSLAKNNNTADAAGGGGQASTTTAETTRVLFQLAQPPRFYAKANTTGGDEPVYLQPAPVKLFTLTNEPTLTKAMHESYDHYVQDRRYQETVYKKKGVASSSCNGGGMSRGPMPAVVCPPLGPHGTPSSSSSLVTPTVMVRPHAGQHARYAAGKAFASRPQPKSGSSTTTTVTTTKLPKLRTHRHNLSHTAHPSSSIDAPSVATSSLCEQSRHTREDEEDNVEEEESRSFAALSISRSGSV